MSKLLDIFVRKEIRNVVKQGDHYRKIVNHLKLLVDEFEKEFTEDNKATRDYFLESCLTDAMKVDKHSQQEVDEMAVIHVQEEQDK
jgi:hypothetical protein